MKEKLLFVETSCISTRYAAEAAISLGYDPFFICRLKEYQADTRAQILGYPHIDAETGCVEKILAALKRENIEGIGAVTSMHDTQLKIACEVAKALGVVGMDPQVPRLKDKGEVARLIPEFSPPFVCFSDEETPIEELESLFRFSDRVLLKPTEGAGAVGAFTIRREELPGLDKRLQDLELPEFIDQQGSWIAQAFCEGEVISLEGYAIQGKGFLLGYTGRRKVKSTESGASFPIDERIPGPAKVRVADAVKALIRRSGFQNGYFHIEFILRGDSCWLIDANVGRIGGGAIAEQLALSYGIRPVEVFHHVLEVGLFGREPVNPFRPYFERRRPTYAILYGLEVGGVIDEVVVPPGLPCYHTQVIEKGGRATPMGQDDWSWVGILSGLSEDTAASIEKLRIKSQGREYTPYY